MSNITLKKVDPFSNDIEKFRREVITIDEGCDLKYALNEISYSSDIPEEVWKFSQKKWKSINFDALYGVYYNQELCSISGAKLYGKNKNFLRLGMHYYTLKKYRNDVRSSLWNLIIPFALNDFNDIDYSFVTIYPHNSRLEAWSQKLIKKRSYGQMGNGTSHINLLRSYSMEDRFIKFNNVFQRVLYRKERDTDISIETLYAEIEDY